MARSAPLEMKVPESVMSGNSPMKISCSFTLPGLLVEQPGRDVQGRRVRGVPLLTFFNGVLGVLVQPVVDELQHQIPGVVLDRGNVVEDLAQAFLAGTSCKSFSGSR